jgi:hypothetical protein
MTAQITTVGIIAVAWLVIGGLGALVIATLRMLRADNMPLLSIRDPRTGIRQHGFLYWWATLSGIFVIPGWGVLGLLYAAAMVRAAG